MGHTQVPITELLRVTCNDSLIELSHEYAFILSYL